jgi:signal transduction histidine kinase
LARELHDSVTQTVFSMNLAAQSTRLLLVKDPSRVGDQLLRIEELAANALAEIQSLVAQLRPRSVTEEGLPTALRGLAEQRNVMACRSRWKSTAREPCQKRRQRGCTPSRRRR